MNTIFFAFLTTLVLGANCVVIRLKDGEINGATARTKEGRLFHKFLGIPYAKPPVNELRFQPPEPVEPWDGIIDATQEPPKCIQKKGMYSGLEIGQEDCLYLNVYIPDELLKSPRKVPVVVGIHGGAFQYGSANDYSGDYFMERDVIFVSMNYRLGVLGFLALNDIPLNFGPKNNITGNFGLKDQSLALKWVKENIDKFGGDRDNVTLLGESAGAASVHFHMFSPLSKGLFQKAIMESGNAFSPWSHFTTRLFKIEFKIANLVPINEHLRIDQVVGFKFLNKTGCIGKRDTLKCLQDLPSEEFTKPGSLKDYLLYLPSIEIGVTEDQAFLPKEPTKTNYQTQVPWLTGINSGEGALVVPLLLRNGANIAKIGSSRKDIFIPLINLYIQSANKSDMSVITETINNHYLGTEDVGLETASHAVDMVTDSSWLYPLITTVKTGPTQQYLYLYDHRGTFSLADGLNLTVDLGVCHGDEIPMLFRTQKLEERRSIEDRRVSDTLLKYWINFAISGNPNTHSIEKSWQPMQTQNENFEYLHIKSDGVSMENGLYKERYNLWKPLPTGWYSGDH